MSFGTEFKTARFSKGCSAKSLRTEEVFALLLKEMRLRFSGPLSACGLVMVCATSCSWREPTRNEALAQHDQQPIGPATNGGDAEKGTAINPVLRPPVFLAVNELQRALLPLAPQLGEVVLRGRCVVFQARGAQATILWPHGTTIDQGGEGLKVRLPTGASIPIPSRTSLTGAHVPLNSEKMTKFSGRLHSDCPNDVFAVSAN